MGDLDPAVTEPFARSQTPSALRLVPPFPAIAHRILELLSTEDADFHDLANLLKKDPSFSAELLRFANSAFSGARRTVTSLDHAIVRVGTERIKTMATMVAMNRMVRSAARIAALRKVWVHSLVTAVIAEEAARIAQCHRDAAYTAGLLHNLGALGLMSAHPDQYSRVLEVSDDVGFDLLQTERKLFEIDHCAAGAFLARDWNFPSELAAVIAIHHDEPIPGEIGLDNLIKVSWRLADAFGFAADFSHKRWTPEELVALLPNTGSSWLGESPDAARTKLNILVASALG